MGSVKRAADDEEELDSPRISGSVRSPAALAEGAIIDDSTTSTGRRSRRRQRPNEHPPPAPASTMGSDTVGSSWLNDLSMPQAHLLSSSWALMGSISSSDSASATKHHPDRDRDRHPEPEFEPDPEPAQQDSCHELERLIKDIRQQSQGSSDGSLTWSRQQVEQVVDILQLALQTQLDKPLTKRDLIQLINDKSSTHQNRASSDKDKLNHSPQDPVEYEKRAVNRLPMDVVLVIVDHLRALAYHDPNLSHSHTQRAIRAWTEINSLARVNKMCECGKMLLLCMNTRTHVRFPSRHRAVRSCCRPICQSETLVLELKMLPNLSRRLQQQPSIALGLRSLHLQLLSFEDSRQAKHDYGFLLPDIIRQVPNLRRLCIIVDRDIAYSRPRNLNSFDDLTGGVRMSEMIVECLSLLNELVYGAPVSMEDIKRFLTLKDLRALDVTGYVDPTPPSSMFDSCLPSLRRFWCPTALFSVSQLHRLFLKSKRLTELAFVYDLDQPAHAASTLTQPELVDQRLDLLSDLFGTIGDGLKWLRIKTPSADDESESALGRNFGAGFAPLIQAAITVAIPIAFGGGAGGIPVPPPPALQAAHAPTNANPNNAAGGPGGPPTGATGGGPGMPPPPFQQAAPPAQHQQRFVFGGGPGGRGAGGMMGGHGFGAVAPLDDLIPFFEMIITCCPHLHHLELYGRRYEASLIDQLVHLPLHHLTLTIPVNSIEQSSTIEALSNAIEEKGDWGMRMKQLELSNMGGEWLPSERRRVKLACDKHGIGFATTDSKNSLF
ncbi:BQ2448_7944 [Microbotryum intermedium]|uniref:BQ2448_7944 protein n=1 Tax=Microbotryum intermedium TaxID=269621 RepID=A0A238FP07_9BASI|nr:BQ2448_7944 [Microbotryum intermedium]